MFTVDCSKKTEEIENGQLESRFKNNFRVSNLVAAIAMNYTRPSLRFSFLNLSEESLSQSGNYFVIYTLWSPCRQGGGIYYLLITGLASFCRHGIIVIATCLKLKPPVDKYEWASRADHNPMGGAEVPMVRCVDKRQTAFVFSDYTYQFIC